MKRREFIAVAAIIAMHAVPTLGGIAPSIPSPERMLAIGDLARGRPQEGWPTRIIGRVEGFGRGRSIIGHNADGTPIWRTYRTVKIGAAMWEADVLEPVEE